MREKKAYTAEELWARATAYCARSEHCAQEVKEKLWQWGCTDGSSRDDIIDRLRSEDYINEVRYCKAYAHDKAAYQGWGRVKIQMMLRAKGISEDIAEQGLQGIDEEAYTKSLRKALAQYADDRQRGIRLALQRGFTLAEIEDLRDN